MTPAEREAWNKRPMNVTTWTRCDHGNHLAKTVEPRLIWDYAAKKYVKYITCAECADKLRKELSP